MSIIYKHIDSSLTTVDDLLSTDNTYSIINVGGFTKIELYSIESNFDNIYNTYFHDDQVKYKNDYSTDKLVISSFLSQQISINQLPKDKRNEQLKSFSSRLKINKLYVGTILSIPDYAIKQENVIVQSNQNVKQESFKEFYVNELRYLELDSNYRHITEELDGNLGIVKKMFPDQTVWLWSKALSNSDNIEGKIVNLSPFILSLNTNVTETGGNWSITLPAILSSYTDITNSNYENDFTYNTPNTQLQRYSQSFNGWQIEGVEEFGDVVAKSIFQDKKRGENYYFYNIIQSNDIIFIRFETLRNEVKERVKNLKNFEISNTELPNGIYDMIGLVDSVVINVNSVNNDVTITVQGRDLIKLLLEDGTYFYSTEYINGGMFVANQDDLAKQKANERVDGKLYQLSLSAIKSIDFSLKFIINALANIDICNDSVFSSYKNADEIVGYDNLQNKFVTKKTDITSKRYTFQFDNNEKTKYKFIEKSCSGIWQIIKLVIDKNVENYRQVDATLGNETGSILNAINKVCQKPFCEFFTDTYRNQFFFIVRRPPFNYEGYKALSEVAITIKSEDVLDHNLNFNDQDTYSWYRLEPQAEVDSLGVRGVWAYLKAIRFEEYASIFGDKCCSVASSYLHYQSVIGKNEVLNINSMARQFIYDFQYMIETYQYMPFVRRGTININGDRRIKRGTVIYFEKTGEYCYVDSVSQSFNVGTTIDRATSIQVSRVMVKDYLEKYFQIIKMPLDERLFTSVNVSYEEFVQNSMTQWKVDKDIFNFFLRRMQFVNGITFKGNENDSPKFNFRQITGKLNG